jgi:arylsulfatase A-like enzyme
MIVYWPGRTAGNSSGALVQNMDIYPTILEAVGIELPVDHILDGVSMMPVLADPDRSIRDFIFSENGYTRSVSDGTYKYIALRYPETLIGQMASGEIDHVPSYVGAWPQAHSAIAMNCFPCYFDQDQVYDLENDPYEQENLYAKMQDTEEFKILKAALEKHLGSFDHPFNLSPIPFMGTTEYKELTKKNLEFDLLSIPWLSRDHGFITWPPEEN